MNSSLNATHNPSLKCWVQSANQPDQDFPIQNLPFGVFTTTSQSQPHVGIAIGDAILDLAVLAKAGLIKCADTSVFSASSLNAFIELGAKTWSDIRAQVSNLLRADNAVLRDNAELRNQVL